MHCLDDVSRVFYTLHNWHFIFELISSASVAGRVERRWSVGGARVERRWSIKMEVYYMIKRFSQDTHL